VAAEVLDLPKITKQEVVAEDISVEAIRLQ